MKNLAVKFMGLELKNPIIVGSSELSNSIEQIVELEKCGAGAIVLKSLFEEEILMEMEHDVQQMNRPATIYPEVYDFFDIETVEDTLSKYLELIKNAKNAVKIPIIASINCVTANEWHVFAKKIENAGADALELNVFVMPSDLEHSSEENEKVYFDIIEKVKKEVKIPIGLKISYYFSNLASMIKKLSETGISSLVLFNRFFEPDFDVDRLIVTSSSVLSTPIDFYRTLRWVAIMSSRVKCDLAATTGVHNGKTAIKQILAGATAVEIVSVLYKEGPQAIKIILKDIENWMTEKGYNSIEEFRGKLSQEKSMNPASYERSQFMKHFSKKF